MSTAAKPTAKPDVRARYREPGVRNYLFAGLAALAMVFVVLFQNASDLGGLLVAVIGVAGLVLRWAPAPVLVVLAVGYFSVFPAGAPLLQIRGSREIIEGRFRVTDMVLVFSAVVYLACQYRVFGLVAQAMPYERTPRSGEHPTLRPPAVIPSGEITRLLYAAAGVVLAGQLLWLFVTSVEVDAGRTFPLKLAAGRRFLLGPEEAPATLAPVATRFVLLTGVVFFGTLLARLVFGYWRLRVMGRAEAAMVVQEAGWNETRREDVRVAKWRAREAARRGAKR